MKKIEELRFVVIDDDPSSRETVVAYLSAFGCKDVMQCQDGYEGMRAIEENPIDFVICDWEMPGVDGLALLKKMRAEDVSKDTPFVMITSPISNEKLKVEVAAHSGVDAYLIKPFKSRVLRQKLHEVIFDRAQKAKKAAIVADDDDAVRDLVVEVLKDLGFGPVYAFGQATEAFAHLQVSHPGIALVVSDWEMPGMTGIEFLQNVRVSQELANTPFIIVTSQSSIEAMKVKKAIAAEVDHYLMKPFKISDLQEKVRVVLARVRQEAAVLRTLENAKAAHEESDWRDAEKLYAQVRALDPRNIDALLGAAAIEIKKIPQNFEEAIKIVKQAIAVNSRLDRVHIELARVHEAMMAVQKATQTLEDAIQFCPDSPMIHFHLGRLLFKRGKNADAIRHLEKSLLLDPGLVEAQELLDSKKKRTHKE